MAGGSFTNIKVNESGFLKAASQMRPVTINNQAYALSDLNGGYIFYTDADVSTVDLNIPKSAFATENRSKLFL